MSHGRSQLTPDRWRRLVADIDRILLEEWDPIGVGDFAEAFDEYSSYAPTLARWAIRGNVNSVADQLAAIQSERMGITPDAVRDRVVADRLVALAAAAITPD